MSDLGPGTRHRWTGLVYAYEEFVVRWAGEIHRLALQWMEMDQQLGAREVGSEYYSGSKNRHSLAELDKDLAQFAPMNEG